MAVSIMTPQQQESGFDKFLRRAGGIAQVASQGINAYAGYKDMNAKSQDRADNEAGVYKTKELDPKDWIQVQEGEEGGESFKIREGDDVVTKAYKRRLADAKGKTPQELANIEADTQLKVAQAWSAKNRPSEAQEKARARADEKSLLSKEKKMASLNEVEDRRRNIEDNLDLVEAMIKDKGTYEVLGSHNADLDRRIDMIATDMAKLADPSSVARPSEVEMFKKGLVSSGLGTKNSTALDLIKNFRSEVNQRAENAYQVRGLGDLVKSTRERPQQNAQDNSNKTPEQLGALAELERRKASKAR